MEVILKGKLECESEEEGFYLTDSEGRRVYLNTILDGFATSNQNTTVSIRGCTKVDESKLFC